MSDTAPNSACRNHIRVTCPTRIGARRRIPPTPVVVVGPRSPVFTGCRVVVTHRAVIANEEDGAEISTCDPVNWAQVWPELRRFYS